MGMPMPNPAPDLPRGVRRTQDAQHLKRLYLDQGDPDYLTADGTPGVVHGLPEHLREMEAASFHKAYDRVIPPPPGVLTSEEWHEKRPDFTCHVCNSPTGVLIPGVDHKSRCVSCAGVPDLAATTPEEGDEPLVRSRHNSAEAARFVRRALREG
jgi:hypothetical protein